MPDNNPAGEPPEISPTEVPEPPDWNWKRPDEPKPKVSKQVSGTAQSGAGIAIAIGYSFVGPILGGILIGGLLDGHVGGTFTMVGLLVGTIAAFALLIRLVNKLNERG